MSIFCLKYLFNFEINLTCWEYNLALKKNCQCQSLSYFHSTAPSSLGKFKASRLKGLKLELLSSFLALLHTFLFWKEIRLWVNSLVDRVSSYHPIIRYFSYPSSKHAVHVSVFILKKNGSSITVWLGFVPEIIWVKSISYLINLHKYLQVYYIPLNTSSFNIIIKSTIFVIDNVTPMIDQTFSTLTIWLVTW